MEKLTRNIIEVTIYQTIILIGLTLCIVSKPLIKSFAELTDTEINVFESIEEETEEEENEEVEDFEDETLEYLSTLNNYCSISSEQTLLFFNLHTHRCEFELEIPIPPPKHILFS